MFGPGRDVIWPVFGRKYENSIFFWKWPTSKKSKNRFFLDFLKICLKCDYVSNFGAKWLYDTLDVYFWPYNDFPDIFGHLKKIWIFGENHIFHDFWLIKLRFYIWPEMAGIMIWKLKHILYILNKLGNISHISFWALDQILWTFEKSWFSSQFLHKISKTTYCWKSRFFKCS